MLEPLILSSNTFEASGSDQLTATPLDKDFCVVSGGAGGVRLPIEQRGYRVTIKNSTGSAINVYPPSDGRINALSIDTAFSIPAGVARTFASSEADPGTTNWVTESFVSADIIDLLSGNHAWTGNNSWAGSSTFNGSSLFNGVSTFDGDITVDGSSLFNGVSTFDGDITVDGTSTFNGNTTFLGDVEAQVFTARDPSGSTSNMSTWVRYADASNAERGWVGFGNGTTEMRVQNNIGKVNLVGSQLQITGTSTSSPTVQIRSPNSSPWALSLHREDLGTAINVYNSGNSWYFGNSLYAVGAIANTGDTIQSSGKIQSYGWDGDYYGGHAVAIGVSSGYSYLHSYNGSSGAYPPLRITAGLVDITGASTLQGQSKSIVTFNDTWLRLNQDGHFTNGIYTPGNVRVDGSLSLAGNTFLYQDTDNRLVVRTPSTDPAIKLQNSSGTTLTWFYGTGNNFGLLTGAGGWALQLNPSSGFAQFYNMYVLAQDIRANGFYDRNDTNYHFYNTSGYTYGSFRIGGARGGYVGLVLDDPSGWRPTFMSKGSTATGIYYQGEARWIFYDDNSYFRTFKTNLAPAYQVSSSRELKDEVPANINAKEVLRKLRPVVYRLKEHCEQEQLGLIAEEAHEVCPWLSPDGKSVAYDRVAMLLLADWQERFAHDSASPA